MSMVRVSDDAKARIARIARDQKKSQVAVVDEALEAYETRLFLERLRSGYRALRNDPQAWEEYERESRLFDGAVGDGLSRSR